MVAGVEISFTLKCIVTVITLAWLTQWYYNNRKRRIEEDALGSKHGCQPVKATLPYRWPFAIDLLKLQYDALPQCRMLEFQSAYFNIAPTIRMDILGTGYIMTDPVNIEAVLSDRFEDFVLGSRREGLFPLLGEGIFTQDGSAWKHSREILRHQFVRVRSLGLDALEPHAMELVGAMATEAKGKSDGVVDLQPHFFEYTLGTTTDLLFGEPHSSLPQSDRYALRDNFDYASMVSAMRLRLADLAWLYTPKKFREACRGVRDWASFFANKAIDHFEEHGEESAKAKYGFIVDLWKSLQDRTLVRDQLLHVLIAGRDTTACLLSWTFFHLVRNPELLDRLKDEIATVITSADQEITRENIKQLPFLDCCLKESEIGPFIFSGFDEIIPALRLYPQLPVNVRYAARATILPRGGGEDGKSPVLLRKGNGVGWSAYHLHRREELYGPDAKVYRPDRWASGELIRKVGLGSGFLDFHAGPRVCLGKDYALMEASYGIIRILKRYPNIRLPPDVPNLPVGEEKQNLTIVLSSAEGVKVLLE